MLTDNGQLLYGRNNGEFVIYKTESFYELPFDMEGTSFPATTYSTVGASAVPAINFYSNGDNEAYIDFSDGTGVHTYVFKDYSGNRKNVRFSCANNLSLDNENLHFYQDLKDTSKIGTFDANYPQKRKVKIWFKYPQNIYGLNSSRCFIWGEFPSNIGNYNLDDLVLFSSVKIKSFPPTLSGGIFRKITLNNIGDALKDKIPFWIKNSIVEDLDLSSSVDLSGDFSLNGFNDLYKTVGLRKLFLNNTNISDVPATLKDSPTLVDLEIMSNKFDNLPQNAADIYRLKRLSFVGNQRITKEWASDMSKIIDIEYINISSKISFENLFTTEIPISFRLYTKLKEFYAYSTFWQSQARTDEFITNIYKFLNQHISKVGDGALRGVYFRFHYNAAIYATNSLRPSGTYVAPSGYIQGTNNGTPANAMQALYVIVNQYRWKVDIRAVEGTTTETLTP